MYTYILKSGSLYKIGKAKCIRSRMFSYFLHNPQIKMIFLVDIDVEKDLHTYYQNHLIGREWFKIPSTEMKAFLKLNKPANLFLDENITTGILNYNSYYKAPFS